MALAGASHLRARAVSAFLRSAAFGKAAADTGVRRTSGIRTHSRDTFVFLLKRTGVDPVKER